MPKCPFGDGQQVKVGSGQLHSASWQSTGGSQERIKVGLPDWGFPDDSDSKEPACNVGDPGSVPRSEDPLAKGTATHSSILAWRIPWTEEPGGLHSIGSQRVRHDWATNTHECLHAHTHTHTHTHTHKLKLRPTSFYCGKSEAEKNVILSTENIMVS